MSLANSDYTVLPGKDTVSEIQEALSPEDMQRRYRIFVLFAASIRQLTGSDFISGQIDENVTDAQADALRFLLLNENVSMGEIAYGLGYSISGATKAMNRLEAKDWVARQTGWSDQREVDVKLTPRGRALAMQILEATSKRVDEMASRMPPEFMERLESVLEEFVGYYVNDERLAKELCVACGFEGGIDCCKTQVDCIVAKSQRRILNGENGRQSCKANRKNSATVCRIQPQSQPDK